MRTETRVSLSIDDLPEGKPIHAEINDESMCVLRRGDRVFAFKDICPHVGGRLSDGLVSTKNHVSCPVHNATFDIETGQSLSFCRRGLTTYNIIIENGNVIVGEEKEPMWREHLPNPEDEKWA